MSQLQDQHTCGPSLSLSLREGILLALLVQLGAAVAVLGGISTVLASYLAKVGGQENLIFRRSGRGSWVLS